MMTRERIALHEVGDRLSELVTPFYKERFPAPEFRKSLTSTESTNLLRGLHELLVLIRTTERELSREDEQE